MSHQDTHHPLSSEVNRLVQDLQNSEQVVILTGAGISVASGITPFRKSADALWEKNVTELATRRFFNQAPHQSWLWYLNRFDGLLDKEPNPAHFAVCELETWCASQGKQATLITQNIDLLHRKAGSIKPIEIHGSADMCRCTQVNGCEYAAPYGLIPSADFDFTRLRASELPQDLPRCPSCDSLVRPHILWFDERYDEHQEYRIEEAVQAISEADLFICIGTSFSVGITSLLLMEAEQRAVKIWGIDPSPDPELISELSWLVGSSEDTLPLLMSHLKREEI